MMLLSIFKTLNHLWQRGSLIFIQEPPPGPLQTRRHPSHRASVCACVCLCVCVCVWCLCLKVLVQLCHYSLIHSKHRCSYFLSTRKIIGPHLDKKGFHLKKIACLPSFIFQTLILCSTSPPLIFQLPFLLCFFFYFYFLFLSCTRAAAEAVTSV